MRESENERAHVVRETTSKNVHDRGSPSLKEFEAIKGPNSNSKAYLRTIEEN